MKKIIFYSFLTCSTLALTYWLSIKYILNSNNLNLPYDLSQPVIIPYPNGVSLGNIESVELATTAKNILWVSSHNGLEIDLNKKQSALFVRKHGLEKLHSTFNFSEKQIDKATNDYWFSYNTKTYRYNLLNKKMQTYDDVGSFLTLFRDNEQLWLGTTQGLFKYNLANDMLVGVPAICNIQVKNIEKEDNSLIINGIYKFNDTENKIENLTHNTNLGRQTDEKYQLIINDNFDWYNHEGKLFCTEKKENKSWQIYDFGKEYILKIKQIDDKILVFGQYKMLIATERSWLSLKKEIVKKEIQKPLVDILYRELRDSTAGNKTILERIAIVEKIKLKYQNSPDSAVQFQLKDLSGFIDGSDDEIKELLDNNTSIAANYKFKLYCDLIRSYTLLGRITLASDYHKKMQNEHFEQKDEIFEHNVAFVHQGRAKMDSIKQYPLSPDALLWAKANVIEDVLHGVDWNDQGYGDFWGNFTASDELYTQLYTKYPTSEFAEAAEWKIKGNCLGYDTCGPPSGSYGCIDFCKDFLRRHPNTKFKKEALTCIIENYAYLGGEVNDNLKEVREGIAFTEKAYREYPQLGDINKDYAYEMMKSNLALLAWELKASLNKSIYREGEDILLNVSLLRNDAVKEGAEIEYKTNTPNCHVELSINEHNCYGYFRENPYCPEVKHLKKTLNPGQKISEQCNLIKKVRHSDYMKDGLYILPKGNYTMVVYWQELAKSEELNFVIE